jgi:hypothetical protein
LLAVNRLIDRQRVPPAPALVRSIGHGELLGADENVAGKDRLYRCLDRLLPHRQDLFIFLRQRWHECSTRVSTFCSTI